MRAPPKYYDVILEQAETRDHATATRWARKPKSTETLPWVYFLRTNQEAWDDATPSAHL